MTEVRRRRARGVLPTNPESVKYGDLLVLPHRSLSIVIYGKPAPQGSKGALGMEDNPRTKPWRAAIKKVCEDHLPEGYEPLDGPISLDMWFYFDPPANAARGSLPITRATYDVDKLARAMGDGLTEGGVIVDDARVVDSFSRKRYTWDGGEARAVVVVSPCRE